MLSYLLGGSPPYFYDFSFLPPCHLLCFANNVQLGLSKTAILLSNAVCEARYTRPDILNLRLMVIGRFPRFGDSYVSGLRS